MGRFSLRRGPLHRSLWPLAPADVGGMDCAAFDRDVRSMGTRGTHSPAEPGNVRALGHKHRCLLLSWLSALSRPVPAEGAGLTVKPLGRKSFEMHRALGGGGSIAGNYEFSPKFRILANAFWSDGGAHCLVGTGPQVVIRPLLVSMSLRLLCAPGPAPPVLSGTLVLRLRLPLSTEWTILGETSSWIRRMLQIGGQSSGMAGLARRTPTTGRFSKRLSIGSKPSGTTPPLEHCSFTRSIRT